MTGSLAACSPVLFIKNCRWILMDPSRPARRQGLTWPASKCGGKDVAFGPALARILPCDTAKFSLAQSLNSALQQKKTTIR
jgi:hypothetical protein